MRWPPWSSSNPDLNDRETSKTPRTDSGPFSSWSQYIEPRTIIPSIILTTTALTVVHVYRTYLRRIPEAINIQAGFFRRRSLFGRVTSVGDGDDFRLFHTPGGRLAGWDWVPGRKVPVQREGLKDRTVRANDVMLSYMLQCDPGCSRLKNNERGEPDGDVIRFMSGLQASMPRSWRISVVLLRRTRPKLYIG